MNESMNLVDQSYSGVFAQILTRVYREQHTVREFAEDAFRVAGINITWKGSGVNEIGVSHNGKTMIKVSKESYRPLESDNYKTDYTKAKEKLGWNPEIKFRELVRIMVESDLKNS